jgi:hypothetical protein
MERANSCPSELGSALSGKTIVSAAATGTPTKIHEGIASGTTPDSDSLQADAGKQAEALTQNADSTLTATEQTGRVGTVIPLAAMESAPLLLHPVAQITGVASGKSVMDSKSAGVTTATSLSAARSSAGMVAGASPIPAESGASAISGASPASAKSAADTSELFAAFEGCAESGGSTVRGLRLSSSELGVGFVDPQHGWVEVHAGASGGAVHASVIAETAAAGQHLSVGMDSVMRQMSVEGQSIASLTVAVHTGGSGSENTQQNPAEESGSSQSNRMQEQSQAPSSMVGSEWIAATISPAADWGGRVSVMA